MEELIKSLKVLSDETRLRMLNNIMQRECCICEVVQALDISQPRASRNLKMLYEVGLLKLRGEVLWSLYSLPEPDTKRYRRYLVAAMTRGLSRSPLAAGGRERLKLATRPAISWYCYINAWRVGPMT